MYISSREKCQSDTMPRDNASILRSDRTAKGQVQFYQLNMTNLVGGSLIYSSFTECLDGGWPFVISDDKSHRSLLDRTCKRERKKNNPRAIRLHDCKQTHALCTLSTTVFLNVSIVPNTVEFLASWHLLHAGSSNRD